MRASWLVVVVVLALALAAPLARAADPPEPVVVATVFDSAGRAYLSVVVTADPAPGEVLRVEGPLAAPEVVTMDLECQATEGGYSCQFASVIDQPPHALLIPITSLPATCIVRYRGLEIKRIAEPWMPPTAPPSDPTPIPLPPQPPRTWLPVVSR